MSTKRKIKVNNLENECIVIQFSTQTLLFGEDEELDDPPFDLGDLIYPINGKIQTEDEIELGYIKCHYIDGKKAVLKNLPLIEVFDCVDDSLCAIGEELFTPNSNDINTDVMGEDYLPYHDFLYIKELYLAPPYRKHGLGLRAIKTTISQFASYCVAVILHACPLRTESSKETEDKAKAKLRKYYESVGFEQIGSSDYLLKNLCYV